MESAMPCRANLKIPMNGTMMRFSRNWPPHYVSWYVTVSLISGSWTPFESHTAYTTHQQMETLRLCPPVITIPKYTGNSPSQLEYNDEMYQLPQHTNININPTGLHYNTEYWGPDAASFDPSRWDASNKDSFLARNDGTSGLSGPGLEYSTIHRPVRGAFVAFSDGFRACVGKKFAQVEFIAVLAVLFRDYEVSLARGPGESVEKVQERAWKALNGSKTVLTLAMEEDVPLSFRRKL